MRPGPGAGRWEDMGDFAEVLNGTGLVAKPWYTFEVQVILVELCVICFDPCDVRNWLRTFWEGALMLLYGETRC